MAGGTVVLGLALAIGPHGGLGVRLVTVALAAGGVGVIFWAKRIGVEVSRDGLVVRRALETRTLKWQDVGRIEVHPRGISQEVDLMLRNGEMLHTTLLQGRVVIWKGGKTKDILSLLSSDLESAEGSERVNS